MMPSSQADTVDRAPFWAQLGESFFAIYFTFEVIGTEDRADRARC